METMAHRGKLAVFVAALAIAVAMALLGVSPDSAWASYGTVRAPEASAENYPANGGDFETNGDVLYVSEIPDGVYEIKAVTTSRMCRFYSSKSGADAGGGENSNPYSQRALLVVEGGAGTAVFYVSSAYSRLYMGSAEDAAAAGLAEDPEGLTDSPAYMRSEPEEDRVYTMAVSALNSPIAFASFNGGRNGVESGTWMSRQVIFQTSSEIFDAIDAAQNPEPDNPDPGTEDPGDDPDPVDPGDEESVDQTEDEGDYSLPPAEESNTDNSGDDDGDDDNGNGNGDGDGNGNGDGDGDGNGNGAGNGNGNGGQGDQGNTNPSASNNPGSDDENDPDGEDGEPNEASVSKANGKKRGVLIVPSILDMSKMGEPIVVIEPEPEEQQEAGLSPAAVALILLAIAAGGGAAWRSVSFGMGKRKQPDR